MVRFLILFLFVALLSSCSTPSILVTQEQQSGDLAFNQNNYPEAVLHYQKMLDASAKLGTYRNLTMEADVNRKIANGYEMMGQYSDAKEFVFKALQLDSLDNNTLNIIEDYRHLGKIEIYQGNNHMAIRYLDHSLILSEGMDRSIKDQHRVAIADNLLVLGQLYSVLGRYNESFSNLSKASALFKDAKDSRGEMETTLSQAANFLNLGDIDIARSLILQSKAISESQSFSTARHFHLLARISEELGSYEDAIRYQESSLEEANKYEIEAQKIWYTIRMGDIYRSLGDDERSIEYYSRAGSMRDSASMKARGLDASLKLRLGDLNAAHSYFTEEGSKIGTAISNLRMGEFSLNKLHLDEAETFLKEAEEMFNDSGNDLGLASTLINLGKVAIEKNSYATAIDYLEQSISKGNYPEIGWQSWYYQGLVNEKQRDFKKAKTSYLKSIEIIESIRGNMTIEEFKSTYLNNKVEVYDRLINILIQENSSEEALLVSEKAKARAFFEMMANKKINFSENSADSLISQEQDKRFRIQQLYKQLQSVSSGSSEQSESRKINQRLVEEDLLNSQNEYKDIIQKLKLYNPEYANIVAVEPVGYDQVRQVLDSKTSILAYWTSEEALHLWFISKDKIIQETVPVSSDMLKVLIENTRRAIESSNLQQANSGLKQLFSLLIKPILPELPGTENLVIIPNGSLHFLPFQALRSAEDKYLVEDFNIIYAPSLNVHLLGLNRTTPSGSAFFGSALSDITIGNNVGLPGTKRELEQILPLFQNKESVIGKDGTETHIKSTIQDYEYIHLATHGFYNFDQPLYSYLLFPPSEEDDGRLTVHEVFELDLDAKLVTLSACQTGLGNIDRGDELVGLSRAFIYAGASTVVVSLWSVADYQTSLLMSSFYKYLSDNSVQVAISKAQRDVLKEFPNPFFWAPFIMIGNGDIK